MIFLFYFYFVSQTVIQFSCVNGDDDLMRFVIEYGLKSAIFGSYNYDPIRQVFDTPNFGGNVNGTATDPHNSTSLNASTISTGAGAGSTLAHTEHAPHKYFRQNKLSSTVNSKKTNSPWWARTKISDNIVKNARYK